jgi:hypothetical protein
MFDADLAYLNSLSGVEWVFLIGFVIWAFWFAIAHPIATILCALFSYWFAADASTGQQNLLHVYATFSILLAMPITRYGRILLIGMGLGFIFEYWIKDKL